ncbi:hypothetical protein AB9F38_34115, partial [Rhizobium leguminosarum]
PERDKALLEGIGVERRPAGEAQSLVCTGFFDDETEKPEDYTDMLLDFKARDVPMIWRSCSTTCQERRGELVMRKTARPLSRAASRAAAA